ncbi:MAG: ANTAR domain-containing protein, partial [Mycobacterium sp.]
MQRHDSTDAQAFDQLVAASQATNRKLVEVARWIVAHPDVPETSPRYLRPDDNHVTQDSRPGVTSGSVAAPGQARPAKR